MSIADALKVLQDDLQFPGDQRKARPLPRVVHYLALWNLALRMLDPAQVRPADRKTRAVLDQLVTDIFLRPLDEIHALRSQGIDPLRTFASVLKVYPYLWEPVTRVGATAAAKLMMVVQFPLQEIRAALHPDKWEAKCALFWSEVGRMNRSGRRQPVLTFRAKLNLPGPATAPATPVRVVVQFSDIPLGFTQTFQIFADGPAQDRPLLCAGRFTVAKEQGNPWATRITHEKQTSISSETLGASVEDTLRFWMQTETVCLALPQ